jgi:broad specificity phosphatase PhoE
MDGAELPVIYLARHGETAWSLTGQPTRLTDLLLTEVGEGNARRLREVLTGLTFAKVFSSPYVVQGELASSLVSDPGLK